MAIENPDAEANAEDPVAVDSKAEEIPAERLDPEAVTAEPVIIEAEVVGSGKASSSKVAELGRKAARSTAREARVVLNDLKAMRFKDEVLPIDESNVAGLAKEFVFWAVTLLGIVPLLIVSITDPDSQFTLFALFFALVWGVIFKMFVLRDDSPWRFPIGALFFTGIVGIYVLLFIYRYLLPDFYLNMSDSESGLVSLLGFVFQVGVWEELTKAVPAPLVGIVAVTALGLKDQIAIIGFDALPEALASVRDGGLAGTVEQFPGGQSRKAMQVIVNYLQEGTAPEEPVILLTPIVIHTDNINEAERLGELN